MSREISALFAEESANLEQSQVYHLIEIELTTLGKGSISNGTNILTMTSSIEAVNTGTYIGIDGIDGLHQVTDVVGAQVTLAANVDTTVEDANVRLYLAVVDNNFHVSYDGFVYMAFPIQFSEVSMYSDGTIDKASMTVANVTRDLMYYVEKYKGLRGRRVNVKLVYERFLDYEYWVSEDGTVTPAENFDADPDAYVTDSFRIDSYTATDTTITFVLDPVVNLDLKVPYRRYTSGSCYWIYKEGDTCKFDVDSWLALPEIILGGYTADDVLTCGKSLSDCQFRKNSSNFGGFPGITGARRVYV